MALYEEDFVAETHIAEYVPTGDPDFKARFAKWPSFKKRNIATLFRDLIQSDDGLQIVLNATAVKFDVDREKGVVRSVTGRHASGRSIDIVSKHCVICAGAIESTRLLLALDRQNDERFFSPSGALGHYFFDHISRAMASIEAKDVGRLNRMAGFRFVESTMRSLRFELGSETQRREKIPNAFGHISFKTDQPSAFDALRDFMRSRQTGAGGASELGKIIKDVPYLLELGFWRFAHHQLLWPRPATYDLHVVAEQIPHYDNRISLADETDMFGMPLAAIDWRVFDADLKTFFAYERLFDAFWKRQGLDRVGALAWTDGSTVSDKIFAGGCLSSRRHDAHGRRQQDRDRRSGPARHQFPQSLDGEHRDFPERRRRQSDHDIDAVHPATGEPALHVDHCGAAAVVRSRRIEPGGRVARMNLSPAQLAALGREVTPLLITFNEAPNLPRVLPKLAWAERIVVVDSGSTDATLDLLAHYPQVEVIFRPFADFASQCNFGLALIKTPWVLSLDADYELSDDLIPSMERAVRSHGQGRLQSQLHLSHQWPAVARQPLSAPRRALSRQARQIPQ